MSLEHARLNAEDIKELGDVLDERRKKNTVKQAIYALGVPSVAMATPLALTRTMEQPSAVLTSSLVLPIVAGTFMFLRKRRNHAVENLRLFHEANIEARADHVDLPIDVVTTKTGNKLLYHEHPLELQDSADKDVDEDIVEPRFRTTFNPVRMRTVANHAQDLGLDAIAFEVTDDIKQKIDPSRTQTLNEWFSVNKNRKTMLDDVYSEGVWVELNAVELHQLANQVERESLAPQLEKYVDLLRARGHSNIPNQYDRYISGELDIDMFMRLVDHEFCSEGQETVLHREFDRLSGEYKIVKEGTYLTRKGDSVTEIATAYDGSATRFQSRTLLAMVGVSDADHLKASLSDESFDITDITEQRARVAIMLSLQDTSSIEREVEEDDHISLYDAIHHADAYRFDDPKKYRRRQMGASAVLGSLFVMAMAAPGVIANYGKDSETRMHQRYEAQSPDYKSHQTYEEFVNSSKSIEGAAARLSGEKNKAFTAVADKIDPNRWGLNKLGESQNINMFLDGSTGDVNQLGGDREIYHVQSLKGATTEGYWGQYVADSMTFPTSKTDNTFYWQRANLRTDNAGIEEDAKSLFSFEKLPMDNSYLLGKNIPHIQVDRDSLLNGGQPDKAFPLTVKQGTEPAAAVYEVQRLDGSLESQPVPVYKNKDNEWYALPPDYQEILRTGQPYVEIRLRYWLQDSDRTHPLRASGPLQFSDGKWTGDLSAFSNQETATKLGKDPAATIAKKTYSLTPLSDEGMSADPRDYNSLDDYGSHLADLESANCNVATTELMIATKGRDQYGYNLNPAIGFRNDGDNSLKVSEAHMWAVNSKGGVIDATPSVRVDQESDKVSPVNWFEVIKYGSGAALIGGLALAGYRRREGFANAAKAVRSSAAKRSNESIVTKPSMTDGKLIGRIQHSLYARPDSQLSAPVIETANVDKALNTMPLLSYKEAAKLAGDLTVREKIRLGKLTLAVRHRAALLEQDDMLADQLI